MVVVCGLCRVCWCMGWLGLLGGSEIPIHTYIYTDPVYINTCTHQAAEAARRDNVALYEKIRYLQAYSNGCEDILFFCVVCRLDA